jgi:hypothetical protein
MPPIAFWYILIGGTLLLSGMVIAVYFLIYFTSFLFTVFLFLVLTTICISKIGKN